MKTKTTLEDHLVECENRFQDVVKKLDKLGERMDMIEDVLLDLKRHVRSLDHRSFARDS